MFSGGIETNLGTNGLEAGYFLYDEKLVHFESRSSLLLFMAKSAFRSILHPCLIQYTQNIFLFLFCLLQVPYLHYIQNCT